MPAPRLTEVYTEAGSKKRGLADVDTSGIDPVLVPELRRLAMVIDGHLSGRGIDHGAVRGLLTAWEDLVEALNRFNVGRG